MKKSKILNILYLSLVISYIFIGIFVLIFSNESREKNNVILGTLILLSTVPHFFIFGLHGGFKNEKKYPYIIFALAGVVIGLVSILHKTISLDKICIIWGCFDICRSSFEICDVVSELKEHEWLEIIELLISTGEIIIAVLLIIDEFEGIRLHLIYFGIVFIISAIKRIIDNFLRSYKNEESIDHN